MASACASGRLSLRGPDEAKPREARGDAKPPQAAVTPHLLQLYAARASARYAPPGAPAMRARPSTERKAMAAQALDARLVDPAADTDVPQLRAKGRPGALPAADADVRVVALRKDPAVAAGNRPELDRREAVVLLPADVGVGHVPFE